MADYQRPIFPWEQPTAVIPKPAEQQMMEDAAVAYETAKARIASPRFIAPGVNLDSDSAIDREVYSPFRRAWGIPDTFGTPPRIFEVGGSVVATDPRTGTTTPVYTSPAKPVTHEFEIEGPVNAYSGGQPKKARMTLDDFVKQWESLPEFAKKSAVNQSYLRAAGYNPSAPSLTAPAVSVPNPFNGSGRISFTRNGVTTTENPGQPKRPTRALASQYVSRFGKDKALAALRQDGYDITGYAD